MAGVCYLEQDGKKQRMKEGNKETQKGRKKFSKKCEGHRL